VRVIVFDTAGPVVGVAVGGDGVDVAARVERVQAGAEGVLLAGAVEVLARLGWSPASLDGVGVCDGPGAFTGLRVGLATAAGLALALDRPLWTASSLATRAARVEAAAGQVVLALLDARKGKMYAETFVDGASVRGACDAPLDEVLAGLLPGFVATGEGALVGEGAIVRAGGRVAPEAADPAVDVLARWTCAALAKGEGHAAIHVRPRYLREPDARPPRLGRL
jgi:tRNA threonylcarbamoyladenosine biosynthesis protein TsaB